MIHVDDLSCLNDQYDSIEFTVEKGVEGEKINFLDLSMSIVNNKHEFGIFRRETCNDVFLQGDSLCS